MKKEEYMAACKRAREDRDRFWSEIGSKFVEWDTPFETVKNGEFGQNRWYEGGYINACYNCIDRWEKMTPNKKALIFYDNNGKKQTFTYRESLLRILEISNWLRVKGGLKTGDAATLYLSTSPYALFTMLACARLGITHNVVFGGFSSEALRLRIIDSSSKCVITQTHAMRGEKRLNFFQVALSAISGLPVDILLYDQILPCLAGCDCKGQMSGVLKEAERESTDGIFATIHKWSSYDISQEFISCVPVPSVHPLFTLYTSGSTGKPKGIVHSTGGYLVYSAYSMTVTFECEPNDIFFSTADLGWITGHTYSVYGPLCLGITSVIMEGLPVFPNHHRLFNIIQDSSITHIYTAPTIIRVLKAYFTSEPLEAYDLSSIRLIGTVGEPINRDAYIFFADCFDGKHVVDTYFQTETGGILVAPIPGVAGGVPECAGFPLPGIEVGLDYDEEVVEEDSKSGGRLGKIFIRYPWPGMANGILGDKTKFRAAYIREEKYFTGDEGSVDDEGRLWVRGRADDVINVSGHRISTAEIESAACSDPFVSEAAVIATPHIIKGQAMILFVVLREQVEDFAGRLKRLISEKIGRFCEPEAVVACSSIPKTSTGKLMRRVLRAIISGKDVGDLSTCINKEAVSELISMYHNAIREG